MNTSLKTLLGLLAAFLLLATPAVAQHSGHGGGGGGHGTADGRSFVGHPPSSGMSHAPSGTSGHPAPGYAGHPAPGHAGHPGHPMGPAGYHGPHPNYAHWYHGDWHDHWGHPWHYGPAAWFTVGFVAGAVVCEAPWHWGYWSYYNPYCTEVIVVDRTPIDYSQPLVLAAPAPAAYSVPAAANAPSADAEASRLLDASRTAFARGDYTQAMALVNQAIAKKPNDPVPHEFRALVLFATRQYKAAAGAVYAVLSVGPGWDWATLSTCYPDPNVYTAQLRALEQYGHDNPTLPEVRFLLAYHYMTCGYNDQAAAQLREAVRLSPRDQLSAQLLAGLSGATTNPPPASAQPTIPAPPVSAAGLVGDWKASRADGSSFAFNLSPDGNYRWQYAQNGKAQQFSGPYSVADNLLILKSGGNPAMIGQVTMLDPNHFNFKLAGTNASDPGLTFGKL